VALLTGEGHLAQIVLSGDICQKTHLAAYGGKGYAHVPRLFVPLLHKNGLSEEATHQMTVVNPARMLDIAAVKQEQN
jgi:phosphotriesterase-related protein